MDKNDQAAIRALLSGDKEAYGALVIGHSAKLFRVAFRITGNEADAEDVVQDAFIRGYRKLEHFEARSDFGTWIYRIAVRCALNKLAGSRIWKESESTDESTSKDFIVQLADQAAGPDRQLLSGEISALQDMAMQSLTAIEQTAFILRHLEDCSMDEIATTLGITPNAAKQAVFRGVKKMRQRLAGLRVKV